MSNASEDRNVKTCAKVIAIRADGLLRNYRTTPSRLRQGRLGDMQSGWSVRLFSRSSRPHPVTQLARLLAHLGQRCQFRPNSAPPSPARQFLPPSPDSADSRRLKMMYTPRPTRIIGQACLATFSASIAPPPASSAPPTSARIPATSSSHQSVLPAKTAVSGEESSQVGRQRGQLLLR
jgi:hypothetical protein